VQQREDEPASRAQNAPDGGGCLGKIGDIHERKIAHHAIEGGVCKTVQMPRIVLKISDH
jgi:hypothetical protein